MPMEPRGTRPERSRAAPLLVRVRAAALLFLLCAIPFVLGATGCPEQPIAEKVEIRILPRGDAVITTNVEFARPELYRDNPMVQQRLQDMRQATTDGRDPWVQRYASLNADAEQVRWDKEQGLLLRVSHRAHVREAESLGRFFSDTPIVMNYSAGDGVGELAIYPGGPWRATQDQQQRLAKVFDDWTRDVAKYLAATRKLYEYVEQNPARARVCIGALFEDLLTMTVRENLEEPKMPDEDMLVSNVQDSIATVLEQFTVPKNESYSADELSHLVYDPFPAAISIRVPGKVLESHGFVVGSSGALTIPGLGLWDALRSLEGRWVSPDPLVAYYMHGREGKLEKRSFDLEGFLSRPRTYTETPSDYDVRRAVEQLLTPASEYKVRWSGVRPKLKDPQSFDWESIDRPAGEAP